jgi:zinc protease
MRSQELLKVFTGLAVLAGPLMLSSPVILASVPEGVEEFTLSNGIRVITRTLDNSEIEGVSFFLAGGSRALDPETQGLERFSLECALMGSSEYPGPAWRELMDRTQAEWSSNFNYDFTRFHVRCIREDLAELLRAFGTCLTDPELEPDAVEQVRSRILSDLQQARSDPDRWIWFVANDAFMPGHPYRNLPDGTPETVAGFDEEDISRMLVERIRSGNILITHAGPTPPEELASILEEAFGGLPEGGVEYPEVGPFVLDRDTLVLLHREELPTAYAVVKFNAPPRGNPDLPAFTAAMSVVDDMLWQVLRTENALTYAVWSGTTNYEENWGYMYVSSPSPVQACSLMAGVLASAASGSLDSDAVTAAVERMRTTEAMAAADRSTQCWLLGSYQLSTGDWRNAYTAFDSVIGLTPEDLAGVLDRWIGFGGWGIMADTTLFSGTIPGPWPLKVNGGT